MSVILLDVDHFKDFNDAHRKRAGDEALRVLAGVLHGAMRQMDVVTRYGGEEFLVILPGTPIDCATLVAEPTRQDISKTIFRYDGRDASLTVSIGVAQLASNRTRDANACAGRIKPCTRRKRQAATGRIGMTDDRFTRCLERVHGTTVSPASSHPSRGIAASSGDFR